MLPERPPSRVRHTWRCRRIGPYREELCELPNGQAIVVLVCQSCDGNDLVDRVGREAQREVDR